MTTSSQIAKPDAPELSDAGLEHLQQLLLHRENLSELRATILPDRCDLCREIQEWALAAKRVPVQ